MLAFENQMTMLERRFFNIVSNVKIAKKLAAIREDYTKPNRGKWEGNT